MVTSWNLGLMYKPLLSILRGVEGSQEGINIALDPPKSCPFFITPNQASLPEGISYENGILQFPDFSISINFSHRHWAVKPSAGSGYWLEYRLRDEGSFTLGFAETLLGYLPYADSARMDCPLPLGSESESSLEDLWDPRLIGSLYVKAKISVNEQKRNEVHFTEFSSAELLVLVYFRMAFPTAYLELRELPKDKDLKPLWKRLCQNLDIRCGKAPRKSEALKTLDLPLELFQEEQKILLEDLNRSASVLPERLLNLYLQRV